MKLNVKAAVLTGGVLWGGCNFLVGILNRLFPPYGNLWLRAVGTLYPGYHGPGGFKTVAVFTLYAILDGAICGFLLAWVYNKFAGADETAS